MSPYIFNLNKIEYLKNKEIYLLHYPKGEELCISYGEIESLDKVSYKFLYRSKTEKGSSGGPIFLVNTTYVIGIHKQGRKNTNEKCGDFIYRIMISLQNNFIYLNGIYDQERNLNLIKYHNKLNKDISQFLDQFNQNCLASNRNLEVDKIEIEMNDLKNNEGEGTITYKNGCYYKGHFKNSEAEGKPIYINGCYYKCYYKILRHGKGTYYNKDNKYIYKGNFDFDKYDGYGEYRDLSNGVIYEGNYWANLMHGKGRLSFNFGIEYEGDFMCGLMEGRGIFYRWKSGYLPLFNNGKYNEIKTKFFEGELKNNCFDGLGTIFYEDGCCYKGEFKNGYMHGKGQFFNEHKLLEYEGDFVNNLFEGKGKYLFKNGEYYIGQLKEGKKSGKGTLYYKSKNKKYEGYFVNDKPEGEGIFFSDEFFFNGKEPIIYAGDFVKGRYEGQGLYTFPNGELYIGEFKNNLLNGNGILFYKNQKIKYEGGFYNNVPEGEGKTYLENGFFIGGHYKKGIIKGKAKIYDEEGNFICEEENPDDESLNIKGDFADNK